MAELAEKTAQLGRSCRHYNALAFLRGEGGCNIGHPIRNIVAKAAGSSIGIAFKLPCRPGPERAAQCPDYDPQTDAEREADKKAMRAHMDQVMKMLAKVPSWKKQMIAKGRLTARANCPCCGGKGSVRLSCALGYNNHIAAQCSECNVGFRE